MNEIIELLDHSQDAETIALEIYNDPALYDVLYELLDLWDAEFGHECVGIIIRNLWDIAYNHGWEDAKAEK